MPRHAPHWTGFCTRCGVHKERAGYLDCLSDKQLVNVVALSHRRAEQLIAAAPQLQPQPSAVIPPLGASHPGGPPLIIDGATFRALTGADFNSVSVPNEPPKNR